MCLLVPKHVKTKTEIAYIDLSDSFLVLGVTDGVNGADISGATPDIKAQEHSNLR